MEKIFVIDDVSSTAKSFNSLFKVLLELLSIKKTAINANISVRMIIILFFLIILKNIKI